MKGKERCKNTCDKNPCEDQCENLAHPKVIRTYINSNVQYLSDTDFFDPVTVNPWGIISLTEKPFCKNIYWVANNGSGKLCKYFHNGELLNEVNVSGPPTGLVHNYTNFFKQYKIITVTLAGTIEGLLFDNDNEPAGSTEIIVDNNGKAFYTGVSINKKRLYVCNFANGKVEMYDTSFNSIGAFTDDALVQSGYYPYNVALNGKYVYVTFANKFFDTCALSGNGYGYVDIFSRDGQLLFRHISRDPLNAPWGLEFSECGKYLYVGNNGDGRINIFDLCSGEFIGPIMDKNCNPIQVGNLWGISLYNDRLSFANGMDTSLESCNIGKNGAIGYLQILK
jgi:uncharacterized protein (TIGR03118 family)